MECKKDFVSIIVPIYNLEKWIGQCIESILKQTYPKLELILIDDGSHDKSLDIAEKYQRTYSQFDIKVMSQSNSGQGAARNRGIEVATGEYLVFVDVTHPP